MFGNCTRTRRSNVRYGMMISFLAALVLFAAQASFAEDLVDRVLVEVDDEIILESEVFQYVQDVMLRNKDQYKTRAEIEELKERVLDELINQKIMLALAEEDTTVIVDDRRVDQTLDERINQLVQALGGDESKLEDYYGKPVRQIRREFRKQVRESMLVEQVRNKKMANVTVTRLEVEDFYKRNIKDLPTLPARINVSHILLVVEPTDSATSIAKARADSLYNQLLKGVEFDKLAIEFSDDRGSGAKGGLLGTVQRGDFVPEFEEVAYALEEGEISEPVRSRFGFHIIRLNWRKGEKINTSHILINLKPTAADEQRTIQQMNDIKKQIDAGADFAELAKKYSKDEDTAKLGGELGWFDEPALQNEFKLIAKDLEKGEVSEPFRTRFGIHILKLNDRTEERPIELLGDWERLSSMAQMEKQDKVYKEWLEKAKKDVYIRILD